MHGISENGRIIFNKPIKRAKLLAFFETLPPCVVGMAVHPIIRAVSCARSAMM